MTDAVKGLSGTWHNQRGSVMTVQVDDNGLLTGTYRSAVGLCPGVAHALTGRFARDSRAVAFCVHWDGTSSATAWSGAWNPSTSTLCTTWVLTLARPSQADDEWQNEVGHDKFFKQQ